MNVNKWILRKIKGLNHERMNEFVSKIAKEECKSKLFVKLDIYWNFFTRGCGYTDYFRGNYINLSKSEKDTFVTAKKFYKILDYLNDERYEIILHDKLLFNKFFQDYLKRDYINLRECSFEEFEKFLKGKDVVFAKTPTGEGGHGVSKVVVKDFKNLKKLYNELLEKQQFLVEDAIIQSRDLNEINPNVVNSFRIVTLYKDGEVTILNNALRINQDDSDVIGCTNDLYFSLGEDGKIDSNVIDDYGTIYDSHPLTKKKFKDVQIKGVKEAFDKSIELARKIPQVRYIGWDFAFTEDGPVLVEGNEYPGYGLFQFYKLKNKRTGHLEEIAQVLKDEMSQIKL